MSNYHILERTYKPKNLPEIINEVDIIGRWRDSYSNPFEYTALKAKVKEKTND